MVRIGLELTTLEARVRISLEGFMEKEDVYDDDYSSMMISAADDYGAVLTVTVLVGEFLAEYRLSPAKWL